MKKRTIFILCLAMLAIGLLVISLHCEPYALLAHVDILRGKRIIYMYGEPSALDEERIEAARKLNIEIKVKYGDVNSNLWKKRYDSYNSVMNKKISSETKINWKSAIDSLTKFIHKRDSVVVYKLNLDSLAKGIPLSDRCSSRTSEIVDKNGAIYTVKYYGYDKEEKWRYVLLKLTYDTANKKIFIYNKQRCEP